MLLAQLHLTLPVWVHDIADRALYVTDDDRVELAIALSRSNVDARSGGPFGAAVFDGEGRLIAVGVNRVLQQNCSLAHAESMAFMLAQQRMQRARLNDTKPGEARGHITLATSAQPCCQCYGATFWAGIDRLLIGARSEDVMALTEFDEGPLPADWVGELERRGIAVVRDLQRVIGDEAREQFQAVEGRLPEAFRADAVLRARAAGLTASARRAQRVVAHPVTSLSGARGSAPAASFVGPPGRRVACHLDSSGSR